MELLEIIAGAAVFLGAIAVSAVAEMVQNAQDRRRNAVRETRARDHSRENRQVF